MAGLLSVAFWLVANHRGWRRGRRSKLLGRYVVLGSKPLYTRDLHVVLCCLNLKSCSPLREKNVPRVSEVGWFVDVISLLKREENPIWFTALW
jgi:hypothetical protein